MYRMNKTRHRVLFIDSTKVLHYRRCAKHSFSPPGHSLHKRVKLSKPGKAEHRTASLAYCLPSQVRNWVKRQQQCTVNFFELNSATSLAPRSIHFSDFPEDCEFLDSAGVSEGVAFAVCETLLNPIEPEFQVVGEAVFPCGYRLWFGHVPLQGFRQRIISS